MPKFNVLLLESIHPVAETILADAGCSVKQVKTSLSDSELMEALRDIHVIGIRSKTTLTKQVLQSPAARDLLAIGAFCIGTNQIDLEAATLRGLAAFNAPFSNTRSVAEMVIAEIIMLSRQLGDRNNQLHAGIWDKATGASREVRGKTLGIVGYGHIGTQVGILAEFLGMRVLYYDIAVKLPLGNAQPVPTLESLLSQSDFVTLHVPETPQTNNLITKERLAVMRQGAYLLNASRGKVVDIEALAEALQKKRIGGAAIDVFPVEPLQVTTKDFLTPLQKLPNVIMTPHIGGTTMEAQENIGKEVASNLAKYLKSGNTGGSVNLPVCELQAGPNTSRFTHVHQNVPGVLRDVNRVVSEAGANVHAQFLATTADIGYLVVDLDSNANGSVVAGLEKLPTTIRARVIQP